MSNFGFPQNLTCLLVTMGDLSQDLLQIPKWEDAQVPYKMTYTSMHAVGTLHLQTLNLRLTTVLVLIEKIHI